MGEGASEGQRRRDTQTRLREEERAEEESGEGGGERGRIFHSYERTRIYCMSLSPVKVPSEILSKPEADCVERYSEEGGIWPSHLHARRVHGSCCPLWLSARLRDARACQNKKYIYRTRAKNTLQARSAANDASALVTTINELSYGVRADSPFWWIHAQGGENGRSDY